MASVKFTTHILSLQLQLQPTVICQSLVINKKWEDRVSGKSDKCLAFPKYPEQTKRLPVKMSENDL